MKSNKDTLRDVVLILVGAVIGIVTGLITAQITQNWAYNEKVSLIANNIRGNVQYELENNDALSKLIIEDISNYRIKKANFKGLTWTHSDLLICSVGNEVGFLKSDVIKKYAHYIGMLRQLQNSRDLLISRSDENPDVKSLEQHAKFYLQCIDILDKAGKDLLALLDKYYPEKDDNI